MDNLLKVGELVAAPGSKVQGFISVINTDLKMPVTLINGTKEGKTISITGGIHGGEYPAIEASVRLAKNISPQDVTGKLIIVHPVNTEAFFAKTQYINPIDGKNLNRVFPGKANGTLSEKIAYTITTEVIDKGDFYIDLHGGDIHEALIPFVIYPKLGTDEQNKLAKDAASMLGIKYVIGSLSDTGTIGSAMLRGTPGFLAEIGRDGLWTEDEVVQYLDGIYNTLRYFKVIEGNYKETEVIYLDQMVGRNADQKGLWYPNIIPGDLVKFGDKLGEIRDFFSNILGEYYAPQDGIMLYVASSLSINPGEPLYAMG